MSETDRTPQSYLREPYSRVVTPDEETGTYTAEILEFPGCVAQGDTPQEAYDRLEAAAESWLEAALDLGQDIPEPSEDIAYSGKIALRLPKYLHQRAARMAELQSSSLNQFLVSAVSQSVGAGEMYVRLLENVTVEYRRLTEIVQAQSEMTALRAVHRAANLNLVPNLNFGNLLSTGAAQANNVPSYWSGAEVTDVHATSVDETAEGQKAFNNG